MFCLWKTRKKNFQCWRFCDKKDSEAIFITNPGKFFVGLICIYFLFCRRLASGNLKGKENVKFASDSAFLLHNVPWITFGFNYSLLFDVYSARSSADLSQLKFNYTHFFVRRICCFCVGGKQTRWSVSYRVVESVLKKCFLTRIKKRRQNFFHENLKYKLLIFSKTNFKLVSNLCNPLKQFPLLI